MQFNNYQDGHSERCTLNGDGDYTEALTNELQYLSSPSPLRVQRSLWPS